MDTVQEVRHVEHFVLIYYRRLVFFLLKKSRASITTLYSSYYILYILLDVTSETIFCILHIGEYNGSYVVYSIPFFNLFFFQFIDLKQNRYSCLTTDNLNCLNYCIQCVNSVFISSE